MRALLTWIAIFVAANVALAFYAPALTAFVNQIPGRDKTVHFVVMGLFVAVVMFSVPERRARIGSFGIPATIPLVLVLVTLEELSQIWLAHRRFALDDLISSYAGVAAFGALAWLAISRRGHAAPAAALRDRT
jgi:hypothetical protein